MTTKIATPLRLRPRATQKPTPGGSQLKDVSSSRSQRHKRLGSEVTALAFTPIPSQRTKRNDTSSVVATRTKEKIKALQFLSPPKSVVRHRKDDAHTATKPFMFKSPARAKSSIYSPSPRKRIKVSEENSLADLLQSVVDEQEVNDELSKAKYGDGDGVEYMVDCVRRWNRYSYLVRFVGEKEPVVLIDHSNQNIKETSRIRVYDESVLDLHPQVHTCWKIL